MNILVTGSNGQLGNEIRCLSADSGHNFIFTDVTEQEGVETVRLDITDIETVRLVAESESVDVIVNCAAYTNVDKAEDDERTADLLNHKAPENLAIVAKECGASLIHISTDYVFGGDRFTPLGENETPSPESAYGRTKLAGEKAVRATGCKSIIIRTAWLYSPYGKNFVKTMRSLTSANSTVKVVFDQVGTPTYAADLAALIMHIIDSGQLDKTGIYHFSNEGAVSWFDFAHEICRMSGNDCEIVPCLSSEFPSKVKRPHYWVLDKSKVRNELGFTPPYWSDSLEKCIERLK